MASTLLLLFFALVSTQFGKNQQTLDVPVSFQPAVFWLICSGVCTGPKSLDSDNISICKHCLGRQSNALRDRKNIGAVRWSINDVLEKTSMQGFDI